MSEMFSILVNQYGMFDTLEGLYNISTEIALNCMQFFSIYRKIPIYRAKIFKSITQSKVFKNTESNKQKLMKISS